MSIPTSYRKTRHAAYIADPDASVHDLLNDATEWLQYARSLTGLLADLVHEAEAVDCHRMALGLEAIGAMVHAGVKCTAEVHARLTWQEAAEDRTPLD